MLNTITNYDDRITLGKQQEAIIIHFLKSKGYNIQLPTPNEDKNDKIDGWFLPKSGGKISFQLKFRENGKKDIIIELIKDWDNNIEGRDLKSKAQTYVIVDADGKLSIYRLDEIKTKAKELLKLADENPQDQSGNGWEIKFRQDAGSSSGATKLIAFLSPSLFTPIASYQIPDYN
jgi:hypothetical protein